jgi:hypothetical protein
VTSTQLKRPHVASTHSNNRQFLSMTPSTILTPRAQSITDTSASRTGATPFSRLHSDPAQRPRLLKRLQQHHQRQQAPRRPGPLPRPTDLIPTRGERLVQLPRRHHPPEPRTPPYARSTPRRGPPLNSPATSTHPSHRYRPTPLQQPRPRDRQKICHQVCSACSAAIRELRHGRRRRGAGKGTTAA